MSQDFFYKPYLSDAESDTESEASDDSFDSSPGASVYSQATLGTVGPLTSVSGFPAMKQSSNPTPVANVTMNVSTTRAFETTEKINTTLFMINSRDRDLRTYPQPTFFTIRLPRVFKQVKQINMTQINLLNSFFNFTQGQSNTNMYVYESGRMVYNPVTMTDISNAINVKIPDGTYTASDLVTALSNSLNITPLFATYPLGDFINYFQSTGDFSVLFNTPGAVVYNSLTKVYEKNQTIGNIVSRYFQASQSAGQVSYSYNECLVAYYYPIVKEMIIAQPLPIPFSTAGQAIPTGYTSWYDYIVFAFTGLLDSYITNIVTDPINQPIFDAYRIQNTFTYSLVNQYNVSYNSIIGRLTIAAPSLNQSIASNLNYQYSNYLNALVLSNGFPDIPTFQTAYNGATNSNSALISFYNFLQSRFTSNFAVNFGQYSAGYYAISTNSVVTFNPLNRYGWNTTLTPSVSASTITAIVPPPQISTLWPNLKYIPRANATESQFISTLNVFGLSSLLSFSNAGESQLGYTDVFYTQMPTKYVRVPFTTRCRQSISIMTLPRPLNDRGPGTDEVYALSPVSTPLLYSPYNSVVSTMYNLLDLSGNLNFNLYTVTQNMFVSQSYMRTFDQWTNYMTAQIVSGSRIGNNIYGSPAPLGNVTLTNFRPYFFLQIDADKYLTEPNAYFRITVYVETQSGANIPIPLTLTWYKDRAGFMADTLIQLSGNLDFINPRHYFQTQTYTTDVSGISMTVDVNNSQKTYMSIRVPTAFAAPSGLPLRIYALLTDAYGTYTIATQLDRLDMPYAGLSSLSDQYTPASAVFQNPTKSIFDPAVTQLGYDISGVSNNLIDYIIQAGSNYYDPNNIESYTSGTETGLRYSFGYATGGATQPAPTVTDWSLFFGSNASNVILDAYNSTNRIYLSSLQTPKVAITGNQYTLANFGVPYSQTEFYVPSYPNSNAAFSSYMIRYPDVAGNVFKMCQNPVTLTTDVNPWAGNAFSNYTGVSGVSFFLPPNDVVQLNQMVVKFVYTQPTSVGTTTFSRQTSPLSYTTVDNGAFYRNATNHVTTEYSGSNDWDDWYYLNRRNTKIGIFPSEMIQNVSTASLSLSSAIATMSLEKVTQVNDYQYVAGASRTRNPDWGTFYTYSGGMDAQTIWDVGSAVPGSTTWISTLSDPDVIPTYIAGETSSFGYFLTDPKINNYTYLPQSFGIATSVANAEAHPTLLSTYISDIPNSYTAVPFYKDVSTNTYKVGTFWGLSFTIQPGVPSTATLGADPYYGTMGPYGWTMSTTSTLVLYNAFPNGGSFSRNVYFWNSKLSFQSLNQGYDPATDLSTFGGFTGISQEYQDTYMFMYKNSTIKGDIADVSTYVNFAPSPDYWSWGSESNTRYNALDDQSGYNFLSYIHDYPVEPQTTQYATHVRGYDPIPKFNTGIRFIGNNFTSFGNPSFSDLIGEISTLKGYKPLMDSNGDALGFLAPSQLSGYPAYNSTISTNTAIRINPANNAFFSTDYANRLVLFDQSFSTSVVFGKQVGFAGLSNTFTGFASALSTYVVNYSTITNNYIQYTAILSTATGELNQYIVANYSTILPANVLNRTRYTDPIPFQILFKSKLVEPYRSMSDNWGLGYYLGFKKADTYPAAVSVTSDSFIKITQNYIYLRLNPEFNMNALSLSSKENLAESRATYSEDQKYFSKIILNNFGSFTQTAVTNPKQFNPVVGRLETLSFQLVNPNGTQISSIDCEYDMVLELSEAITGPKDTNSLQTTTADLDVYRGL